MSEIDVPKEMQCALCAVKHLGKAKAKRAEVRLGYPENFWSALGEMAVAEDHLCEMLPDLAGAINAERKAWEADPFHSVNFDRLMVVIARAAGYDLDVMLTAQNKETLA